jgi:hypothetical protein
MCCKPSGLTPMDMSVCLHALPGLNTFVVTVLQGFAAHSEDYRGV